MVEGMKQIKLLGEGAFGKCYLCEKPEDKSKWVVKQIDISKMTEKEKREAYHEAKIMAAFDHPNIVKFNDVYTTKNGKLNIVMDFADGGDLAARIEGQRGRLFPEKQILDWFVQICLALKHVHDRKVLHRDIKAQNVFLMKNGMVKLGDFGISRVLSNTMDKARTMVGTPYYLSPEIIENKPYSFKTDVWSVGVLLYEMCTLKPPFDASSLHFLALKIVRGAFAPIAPEFSRDLKNLLEQMLLTDAGRRPTIAEILRTPFIRNRIQGLLSESVRLEEFSHTILHKQNVFDTKAEVERKAEEEKKIEEKKKVEEKKRNEEKKVVEERKKAEIEKRLEREPEPLKYEQRPKEEFKEDFRPLIREHQERPAGRDQNRPRPHFQERKEPPKIEQRKEPPKIEQRKEPPKIEQRKEPPKIEQRKEHPKIEQRKVTPQNLRQEEKVPYKREAGVWNRNAIPPKPEMNLYIDPKVYEQESAEYRQEAKQKQVEPPIVKQIPRPPQEFRGGLEDIFKPVEPVQVVPSSAINFKKKTNSDLYRLQREEREEQEEAAKARKEEQSRIMEEKKRQRDMERKKMMEDINEKKLEAKKKQQNVSIEWIGDYESIAQSTTFEEEELQSISEQKKLPKPEKKVVKKEKQSPPVFVDKPVEEEVNLDYPVIIDEEELRFQSELEALMLGTIEDSPVEEPIEEEAPPPEEPLEEPIEREDELGPILEGEEEKHSLLPETNEEVEEQLSVYSKIELFKIYIEEKIGTEKFLAIYWTLKKYEARDTDDWNYETCYSELQEILHPDDKEFIELVHTLIFLEEHAENTVEEEMHEHG